MVSKKKQRGQQRKAAKSAKNNPLVADNDNDNDNDKIAVNNYMNMPLAEIGKGNQIMTQFFIDDPPPSFVESGILFVVLNFLQRCESERLVDVMDSVGGDLESPSTWINLISKAVIVESSCQIHVAIFIGPLVRCMCADTTNLCYKSKNIGVRQFCHLLH